MERIAVLTCVILRNTSYFRALKELKKTIIPRKIGLKSANPIVGVLMEKQA